MNLEPMAKACKGLTFLLLLCTVNLACAQSFSHKTWDELLKNNLVELKNGSVTQVNYAAMKQDRNKLKSYLASLSQVSQSQYQSWSEAEQLAFLINAYNAWTVEFILTAYPNIDSIKDLASFFSSPWSKKFIPLLGGTLSLDNIEHDMIRKDFKEPRIHFAVNCASVGCPALKAEAYVADRLESQLEAATLAFLSDKERNRLSANKLEVSKIFDWYESDFEQKLADGSTLGIAHFFVQYAKPLNLSAEQQQKLIKGEMDIDHLDYDWKLNRVPE